MVANLEIIEGRASMFYAGDSGTPWHKNGTKVETAVTYKEALELANMNHTVESQPLFLADGTQLTRYVASVRSSDGRPIGVTRPEYRLIQNEEVGEFLDSLYQDGKLLFDTAGIVDNGSTVLYWMLARLQEDMRVGEDLYGKYLLGSWSHDGLRSFRTDVTNVRVVCENTLNAATGGKADMLIRHIGDTNAKLATARALFQIVDAKHRRLEEWLNRLVEVKVEEPQVTAVQEAMFGVLDEATPTQRKNAINAFLDIYKEEREHDGETAYALACAVTGFADHKTRIQKASTRMGSFFSGPTQTIKATGLQAVGKVAEIPFKLTV